MEKNMNLLEQLNNRQQEAVLETEGYVRVIAGAGSGKTKLLVSRYAYLVQEYGMDSASILCVTFTNKAAGEMKRRIKKLIGEENDTTLVCTYHGFCNRLLREEHAKMFLNKQFQILDSYAQKSMLSEIYQRRELKLDYAAFEKMLHKLNYIKTHQDYVPKMRNPEKCQILDTIKTRDDEILEEYLQRQKSIYRLDFNDLISYAIYVLKNFPEVRDKWCNRLNYIMVDEFQDSSCREMELIEILSGKYRNLMIVGDPDQNIYEWRGSDVSLLVDFDKIHADTKTIFLNQNYRSTPQILKCANTLIAKNQLRLEKELFTENDNGPAVYHYHSKNELAEMDQVIDCIKQIKAKENYSYSDFAILYRSSFLSRVAEKKLVERNVPYEIFGGVKFYQRMEILDLLAFLKLIAYDDDFSFKRIINTPRRKFGKAKMTYIDNCRVDGHSYMETLIEHLDDEELQGNNVGEFCNFIVSIRRKLPEMRISEIVNEVSSETGYEAYIRELGDNERLDNLAEFKRIANEFESEFGENLTLDEFLQQIALQSGEDDDQEKDAVKLMTIHASKGLEFPVVFILGISEGIFPSSRSVEERKRLGLEEERRLCYVAITRAERHLFLMESEGEGQNGNKKLMSRFLQEIGEENYIRVGKISDELLNESKSYIAKLNVGIAPAIKTKFAVGDHIEHHVFGSGVILSVDEIRGDYCIQFDKLKQSRNIVKSYFEKNHEPVVMDQNSVDDTSENKILDNSFEEQASEESAYDIDLMEISELFFEEESPATDAVSVDLSELKKNSKNLWKQEDVPHSGWKCVGVDDLGAPAGICEMCGYQIIRYAHMMEHPSYHPIVAGCVCAGRMEGDIEAAKKRENEFKNRQARRVGFFKRKWKHSVKGNEYLKVDEHVIVLYKTPNTSSPWKYSIDMRFGNNRYTTREQCMAAAFESLESLREKE